MSAAGSRVSRSSNVCLRAVAVAAASLLPLVVQPGLVRADDTSSAQSTPSVQFTGVINANDVYVRSGFGDNYYATMKLEKGATVTVVGVKFDWLKIVPPEGSFSYVAKAYVEKRGDGSIGRVTKPDLNVRAGSSLNAMKTTVQTKLDEGVDVQIIGEQDEYFKIKPPAGAYLYVNKQFVDPVRSAAPLAVAPASGGADSAVAANGGSTNGGSSSNGAASGGAANSAWPAGSGSAAQVPVANTPVAYGSTPAASSSAVANGAGTGGGAAPSESASAPPMMSATPDMSAANHSATTRPSIAAAPTTQGSGAVAAATTQPSPEAQFDNAEAAFLDATNQPLQDQPLSSLIRQYTTLADNQQLPASMRRIADMRLSTLRVRLDARQQYDQALSMEKAAHEKQVALQAEQQELQQRVKQEDVTMYTAVGTLRTSSLQSTGGTLYRLTDPNSGRTLLYIRSDDPKYAGLLNQFIGVRGDITQDGSLDLKIITPTVAEPVDESKVNTTVAAQLIPPTLMPKASALNVRGD